MIKTRKREGEGKKKERAERVQDIDMDKEKQSTKQTNYKRNGDMEVGKQQKMNKKGEH